MSVFNPKILDASIRDVSLCLSDNQKADLLLYALNSLSYEGRSRTLFENAIQSCLQVTSLSPENAAKARILRARARLSSGSIFAAQEDLQAALEAEPDNPEAAALLHRRSVNVEKLLAPQPITKRLFSTEIWREIALFLPLKDLKTLLFVPNPLSRIACQLLFRRLDIHFSGFSEVPEEEVDSWRTTPPAAASTREQDSRHAQRTADILTRVITDPTFASVVRTLRIFSFRSDKDGSASFQTGMLSNALPKLVNLRYLHITAPANRTMPILQLVQVSHPRLRGLALQLPNSSIDLSSLTFQHLAHFAYETNYITNAANGDGGDVSSRSPSASSSAFGLPAFLAQNRATLRTLSIQNASSTFPSTSSISIRNLAHIEYLGQIPASATQLIPDLLTHGRQLEHINLTVLLDCALSPSFRSLSTSLPFLRHFSFSIIGNVSRRLNDRDLFPSIVDFLRDRKELKTLTLTVGGGGGEAILRSTGYDASIWGVLPTLTSLRGLTITYPKDLAPGLGAWLIPRTVVSLALDGFSSTSLREPLVFLNQLRTGIPSGLLFVALLDFPFRSPAQVLENGFPMVRLIRIGGNFWTVLNNIPGYRRRRSPSPSSTLASSLSSSRPGYFRSSSSRKSSSTTSIPAIHTPGHVLILPSSADPALSSSSAPSVAASSSSSSAFSLTSAGTGGSSTLITYDLEPWPKRRAVFHAREWLDWIGCEVGEAPEHQEFAFH